MIYKAIIWKFLLALGIGVIIGAKLINVQLFGFAYFGAVLLLAYFAVFNKIEQLFTVLPFVIYSEIFVRDRLDSLVPYLTIQYLYIFIFSFMLIRFSGGNKPHNKAFYFLLGFAFLEIFNGLNPDRPKLLRSIFFNSFSMILAVIWASHNVLTPKLINKILANVKLAGMYLSGIVIVAQVTGGIDYGNFSNSESSNGLAPVQLSGYLSVAACFIFFSLMNKDEIKSRYVYIIAFSIITGVMILTFSRGGLYFLGAILTLYLFFNRKNLGNYFKYLLFLPIGLVIYNLAIEKTEGKIIARYEAKGTSNRDILVEAAFKLFLENPVVGVGTSNYGTAIVEYRLFNQESTAHNEFARAMAEHGILGIITYWGFFISLFITIFKRKEPAKQFSVYFIALFIFITIHNGLKISIQHLLIIMAIANPTAVKAIFYRKIKPNTIVKQSAISY
ncbi:MAG TPA: O-antigen ligase family protein [Chitinophagaceae bacterium]|nr:O-antigen ligase family protein [Chitinophagaceae bacterium]MCC6636055.1 O-antigen ligase family protein [Chitinophagaceae bacterium]HMZ45218.1 O-antigen ligase family protein [Chitinophagaceae bacterium]HNE92940.1 O-antigen ligase family protein [Chitinophagaceae bacterium]HNF29142.1 O-antigen ligase family protein [Chitinophagaceae bacterium]